VEWIKNFALIALLFQGIVPAAEDETTEPIRTPEILERALEKSRWYQEQKIETKYTFRIERTSEKLDESGDVKKRETTVYTSLPFDDFTFERLESRDGRPLDEKELKKEEERQRKFEEQIQEGKKPKDENQRVVFDEKLVRKYRFEFEGTKSHRGRDVFVLSYVPRSEELPVENRMDYALNKAEGEIWIDTENYEVCRATFQLREKVKLWWGLIGSISDMAGTIERVELEDGLWMPEKFELYMNGRILFSSLHRREEIQWSGFRKYGAAADSAERRNVSSD
jgi:hypothetical protein